MPKRLIYKFAIDAYTPDTIPMSRLSEYMGDLAGLLGQPSSVHFSRLEEGSTVVNVVVETEAVPKVSDRVASLSQAEVPLDVQKYFTALDRRLADDNATGILTAYEDDQEGAVILQFPGRERPKPVDYGVITERGSLDGVPITIGGSDKTAHVILEDCDKTHTGIDLTRELAMKLSDANCLYRKTVRLHGIGRWHRTIEGEWELKKFRVEDFEILGDAPLSEIVGQLRSVPGSGWEDVEDPDSFLKDLRSDSNDRPH